MMFTAVLLASVVYSQAATNCVLDLAVPATTGFPTLVWLHGGGLTAGHRYHLQGFDTNRFASVAVDYRLVPQGTYTNCVEDAAAAVAWTLDHIGEYGGDPKKVFVGGHSAGGWLTYLVGMDPRWLKAHGHSPDELAGLLPISGQTTKHFNVRSFEKDPEPRYSPRIDEWAPFRHVRKGLPPMLIVVGDPALDIPARVEENALMAASLRACGNPRVEYHSIRGTDHCGCIAAVPSLAHAFIGRDTFDENLSVLLSDIHLQTNPSNAYAFTAREFPKRVQDILALRPRPRRVICFGDMTFDAGEPAAYAYLREQIRPLEDAGIRVILGMGNHDRRKNFLAAFPEAGRDQPVPGRIVYKVDLGTCDLILLDTLNGEEKAVAGEIGEAQADWLVRELAAAKRPVILGAHHPQEELSVRGKSLLKFMRDNDKVVGWINGHNHYWRKENLFWGGGSNEDVIRSVLLPTGGAWGEIGMVFLRTCSDRAVAELKMIDMVWHDALEPGERRPKSYDAIVGDQDGDCIVFPFERPLRHARMDVSRRLK